MNIMYLGSFVRVLNKRRENIGGDTIKGIVACTTTNPFLMYYHRNM